MNNEEIAARAQQITGHQFADSELLITALTHSSVADTRLQSNERLEFLGDAVLGMVICNDLYHRFGDWDEGDLTKVKSVVVSRRICADVSDAVGLTDLLILGNGIDARNSLPTSLRAAVFEAVVGAVFLDGGLEPAERFIRSAMARHVDECSASEHHENYKSALQQYAQRYLAATPQYESLDEQGPDHSKCFEVCVVVGSERFPSAWGPSKKHAEQEAARRALEVLTATARTPTT